MSAKQPLEGLRILIFAYHDYEDLELWYPKLRLQEAGAHVTVAAPESGVTYRGKHGYPCVSDVEISKMDAADFHGVVCPGGWMPDKLRRDPAVLDLLRAFDRAQKLVASICHGGWICISAGIVRGRNYTGSAGIRDDLVNAGALFRDAAVVVDGHHVSSRKPEDLPEFMTAVLSVLDKQAR